jgi:Ca-activated chloride channel family protein
MKTITLGMLASLGMVLVGGGVYAVTPDGGFGVSAKRDAVESTADERGDDEPSSRAGSSEPTAQFSSGEVLKVEGRVGHASLLGSSAQETFVLLELRGEDKTGGEQPKVDLSIVIDKSGSMREGSRLPNALSAAAGAVERLRDGDTVSVIAFDTRVETVVSTTTVNASSRPSIVQSIRGIQLGGDTCISCGLEEGLSELKRSSSLGSQQNAVQRILLLSDGIPTSGVRDVAGFRAISQRAMAQNVSVTTIGVDVGFDENIMTAIALAANGRHYFVANDADLARVFEQEATTLTASVASNAVAEIELASGVELLQVFDRTFNRSGSRVSVPLGSFGKGEAKTVLLKVRIPSGEEGVFETAKVKVAYRDLVDGKDATEGGTLGVERVRDASKVADLDGVVLDRVQRSETAAALRDANSLFNLGKADEARRRLGEAQAALAENRNKAKKGAPPKRARDVDQSFSAQEAELNRASNDFATPPPGAAADAPAQRRQQESVKQNAQKSLEMAF